MTKLMLLQLVLLPSAFRIMYPANVIDMIPILIELSFLDVLPSEQIVDLLFTVTESPASNPMFENITLESDNFLLNVGSSVIILHI